MIFFSSLSPLSTYYLIREFKYILYMSVCVCMKITVTFVELSNYLDLLA